MRTASAVLPWAAASAGAVLLLPALAASVSTPPAAPGEGHWTKWYGGGGKAEPPDICPAGTWLAGFTRMDCSGLLRGLTGVCSDGSVMRSHGQSGPRNATINHPAQTVSLRSCAAVDQLAGCGGRGGDPYTAECEAGRGVAGVQLRMSPSPLSRMVRGVRFRCEPLLAPGEAHATFSLGCFWNAHAAFAEQPGVLRVERGYTGGFMHNPAPAKVADGSTGHAESVRVTFDTKRTTFSALLAVFWASHNPSQRMGQGRDVGSQFRSVIWAHDAAQKEEARKAVAVKPGVSTEVRDAQVFHVSPLRENHCKAPLARRAAAAARSAGTE
eukprot:TRINITY_DN28918_c0_g1_i1.p1 TRINITY_DN28918_c0_g1~~TRINITY_DN28918_c0_g1_i1.p1  ORF type:complete len:347 (+),score=97.35 TRINITY_DN28918_c0_g1_i1:65-1042(+)